MTKEELVARLCDIEWDDFEVKAAKSELPKNIWETVSAFSNTSGGWIVLGVKQSGKTFEVQGVDNIEKLEQDFLGTIRSGKFNQTIFARPQRYDIDSCKLLVFYIPEVDMKPVCTSVIRLTPSSEWVVATNGQRRVRYVQCSAISHLVKRRRRPYQTLGLKC